MKSSTATGESTEKNSARRLNTLSPVSCSTGHLPFQIQTQILLFNSFQSGFPLLRASRHSSSTSLSKVRSKVARYHSLPLGFSRFAHEPPSSPGGPGRGIPRSRPRANRFERASGLLTLSCRRSLRLLGQFRLGWATTRRLCSASHSRLTASVKAMIALSKLSFRNS